MFKKYFPGISLGLESETWVRVRGDVNLCCYLLKV